MVAGLVAVADCRHEDVVWSHSQLVLKLSNAGTLMLLCCSHEHSRGLP